MEGSDHNRHEANRRFRIGKKHIQGFIAGALTAVIALTGLTAAANPGYLAGTFTRQVGSTQLKVEVDMQYVSVTPETVNAGASLEETFSLNIGTDKLNTVSAGDITLWGYFDGMTVAQAKEENGRLQVTVKGKPKATKAYDAATDNDNGYIAVYGGSVKEKNVGYQTGIPVVYPRFKASPEKLTTDPGMDTDITLTLQNDTFAKTPTTADITLDGGFKNMTVSGVSQTGDQLAFHLKGGAISSIDGVVTVSGNVLNSGVASQKIIPISGAPCLYSFSPATVAAPLDDTLVLRVDNDSFKKNITPDMFTMGGRLAGATVSKVEHSDSGNLYVTLSANELRETGRGTITLSGGGLASGQSQTAQISVEAPSISLVDSSDTILAAPSGKTRQYTFTVAASGNDFRSSISPQDFVLKGALASSQVTAVNFVSGFEAQLTVVGSPEAGQGVISVRTAALGGVTGAECPVDVVTSMALNGEVNLASGLAGMEVSFYDKNGEALDIPSAATVSGGLFCATVTSEMPVDDISYVRASDGKTDLTAPFRWDMRNDVNINAFTSLMQYSIAKTGDRQEGVRKVYSFLGLADRNLTADNSIMLGSDDLFSHDLFVKQANGDVDGYLKALEQEMDAGKTRSFVREIAVSGQTGGLLEDGAELGLKAIATAIADGIKDAAKDDSEEGVLYILRQVGILGPDTNERLNQINHQIAGLSTDVRNMQASLTKQLDQAEIHVQLSDLTDDLNAIRSLYTTYQTNQGTYRDDVEAYQARPARANFDAVGDPAAEPYFSDSLKAAIDAGEGKPNSKIYGSLSDDQKEEVANAQCYRALDDTRIYQYLPDSVANAVQNYRKAHPAANGEEIYNSLTRDQKKEIWHIVECFEAVDDIKVQDYMSDSTKQSIHDYKVAHPNADSEEVYIGLTAALRKKVNQAVQSYDMKCYMPDCMLDFGPNGTLDKADLNQILQRIEDKMQGSTSQKSLITAYYKVLTESLPFEVNAASEIYAFANYVAGIEGMGMQLYADCEEFISDYNHDPSLLLDLQGEGSLADDLVNSLAAEATKLLPDESVFSVYNRFSTDNVTLKPNNNPSILYMIPKRNLTIKDQLITYSNGKYHVDPVSGKFTGSNFNTLTNLRTSFNLNMSTRKLLETYGGMSDEQVPGWFLLSVQANSDDPTLEFYDTEDEVVRTYKASDLYNSDKASWVVKVISIWNI